MAIQYELSVPPARVDRLIVHQFDPLRTSPGGIDTCIRGIARYAPQNEELAFVGVDATEGSAPERVGRWEVHRFGDRRIHFLPVVSLDPANQRRRVPHSARLTAGLIRHRSLLPRTERVQVHRMDTALACLATLRIPMVYFVHTQEGGLTGATSDSFWRYAGRLHHQLEKIVVGRARDVVVFNEGYSHTVRQWNPAARFCPTWFDPAFLAHGPDTVHAHNQHRIVWVGRLETPKDPLLAVESFAVLVSNNPDLPWKLDMLGSGTMMDSVRNKVAQLDPDIGRRISVHGRVEPEQVASIMTSSDVFLMTSHPGYEGYPRVLVESLAAGLPAVVTDGSDTGGLIKNAKNGFVTNRSPDMIAACLQSASSIDRSSIASTVAHLAAPTVVDRLFKSREVSR